MPYPARRSILFGAALLPFATPVSADESPQSTAPSRLIGMATMKPDGTIVLDLHGGREANYAMGQIEYPPMHKDYAAVLKHLGGLAPGQSKGVPPWPDQ
jgi:hypothetical protein